MPFVPFLVACTVSLVLCHLGDNVPACRRILMKFFSMEGLILFNKFQLIFSARPLVPSYCVFIKSCAVLPR